MIFSAKYVIDIQGIRLDEKLQKAEEDLDKARCAGVGISQCIENDKPKSPKRKREELSEDSSKKRKCGV